MMCLIAESFNFSGGLAGILMTKGQILPLWIPCGPPPLSAAGQKWNPGVQIQTYSKQASTPPLLHVEYIFHVYIYISPMFFTNKYSKSINPTYWIQQPIFLTWDGTKNTLSSLQQTFCKSKNANCKDPSSFIAKSWYTIAGWFICSL